MGDYKDYCIEKFKNLESFMLMLSMCEKTFKDSKGHLRSYIWYMEKDGKEIQVVVEFDENEPYAGIYYGCRLEMSEDSNLFDLDQLKQFYYDNYWSLYNSGSISSMENVFLKDEEHEDKNNKKIYWPFWIRLEEKYPIAQVMVGAYVIREALKEQGWNLM